jgi:cation transport ATPase
MDDDDDRATGVRWPGFLDPLIAGAAMTSRSLLVVINSQRLRRFQPDPARYSSRPG